MPAAIPPTPAPTPKKKVLPRKVPSREDKYMGLCFWYASFSKDPRTQVGAQIVTMSNEPLGYGYNGPPKQIIDTDIDWDRPQKYPYIKHAERNAIDHSDKEKLAGATIYVTAMPCPDCMLDIIGAGIKKVIYYKGAYHDSASLCGDEKVLSLSEEMVRTGNVMLLEFKGNLNWMRDRMEWMVSNGIFE
jgi:dCMP deaminase